jgi:predicted transglutaminase-like cysteine proteinase
MLRTAQILATTAVFAGACSIPSADAAFFSLPRMLTMRLERIAFDAPALPPLAHSRFCLQYPADCEVRRTFRQRTISLTEARWTELMAVNRDVNRAIVPQRNLGGVLTEEWLLSPKAGDCNDYAVTKRHELLARGWPSRTLILAEVVIPRGEHHLVLVVRTAEGDVVLDNLTYDIRPVATSRYRWVRAQQQDNPKFWSTVHIAVPARTATPVRTQVRLAHLHSRATMALRKAQAEDCCRADREGKAKYTIVAERQEQE